MNFDETFKAVSANTATLATKLSEFAGKGGPTLQLEAKHDLIRCF